jgi:adenine/guanine phosphoribosyltransferase-like PRPP-binding protein
MDERDRFAWPEDFPRVTHFIDLQNCYAKPWDILRAHPDYDAAKNHEDKEASMRLVIDFLKTEENQAQLKQIKERYQDAIIVPIQAVEAQGKNRIPLALAEYIGHQAGLEIDTNIVQKNKVPRTGSDEWHRLAFRPQFEGEVKSGRRYVLVDDVFAQGGSFSELRLFIEKNGGKAVHAVVMSLGGHGDSLAPSPEGTKKLLDKFGEKKIELFLREIDLYEGQWSRFTGPETFFLRRAASLDEARDRILAARQAGFSRMGEESACAYQAAVDEPELPKAIIQHKPSRHW